uniref:Uncharacterized protein n=1 Tax=Trypanosoma vivax (strain Y486) TaxID=1055687 RepID=G0TZL2_TRYVY|nr:conserved hypothetical protein, fragment [Trypanosoma vivax Y486]
MYLGALDQNKPENGGYLEIAARLCVAAKPLLATKAYERALSSIENYTATNSSLIPEVVDANLHRNFLLKDFLLYCNAFSVSLVETNKAVAEDFLCLCMPHLERKRGVRSDQEEPSSDKDVAHREASCSEDGDDCDEGLLYLEALTYNNMGCILLRSGDVEGAGSLLGSALEVCATEELARIILLNICAVHVHACQFAEARTVAVDVLKINEQDNAREKMLHHIQSEGLKGPVVGLIGFDRARKVVFGGADQFESPFSLTRFTSLTGVVMLSLCGETPLHVADRIEKGSSATALKSMWSLLCPHSDAGGIFPPVKGVPNLVPSPVVAEAVKTLVPLPPLSEKVIANAQRGITGVRKMLNNRLATLIRAENAFEEKWRATMMVKNALVTFTFVQDFIKLKVSIRERRARQIALEKSSARRILRFFRLLLSAKEHSDVPIQPVVRIRYFETRAAVTLQKYARRWLARQTLKRLRRERELLHLRATRIQGLYHTRIARLKLFRERSERHKLLAIRTEEEKREYAAVRIQRAYRRHVYRLSKWREAGEIKKFLLHHHMLSRVYSATLIQKNFRGFLVRRQYGPKVYARRCYGRNRCRAAVANRAAKRIQAAFRAYLVHRKTRASLITLRAQCVLEREMRNEVRRRKAAVTIQCAYRSYVARARMIGMRSRRKQERLLRRNRVFPSFRLEEQVY